FVVVFVLDCVDAVCKRGMAIVSMRISRIATVISSGRTRILNCGVRGTKEMRVTFLPLSRSLITTSSSNSSEGRSIFCIAFPSDIRTIVIYLQRTIETNAIWRAAYITLQKVRVRFLEHLSHSFPRLETRLCIFRCLLYSRLLFAPLALCKLHPGMFDKAV